MHQPTQLRAATRHLLSLTLAAALTACGGGSSSSDNAAAPTDTTPAVTILAQPLDSQVTSGAAARFSVSTQQAAQAYQWQRSTDGGGTWTAIADATGTTLELTTVAATDDGHLFRVLIRSGGVDTPSSAAKLSVAPAVVAPAITVGPASVQVVAGTDASFTTTASGTSLAYQWQRSSDGAAWTDIAGQTGATLTLAAVTTDSNGLLLRVVVSNSAGNQASDAAQLSVQAATAAASITTQPAAVAVVAPAAASFSVVASGQPAPSFQWQRSTDGGTTYTDIPGATASSYSTGPTSLADNGQRLRVLVSNSAGSVLSQAQVLSVSAAVAAPAITLQPQDQQVAAGQVVTFSTTASGTPTPTLQWQLSTDGGSTWANIVGATAGTYAFTAAAGDDGRRLRVVATNSSSSATSRAAVLAVTVAASPLAGRSWTTAQSLEENTTAIQVTQRASAIDDAGRVTMVFIKSDGTRDRVYATRGMPNGALQAPTWTAPAPINGSLPASGSALGGLSITSAPGGDMVVLWSGKDTCSASSYLGVNPLFTCQYHYIARYRAATDTWEAPELFTDTDSSAGFETRTNDRGDLLLMGQSWIPGTVQRFTRVQAVFMRAAGETSFRRQVLATESPSPFETVKIDLDAAGNLLMAAKVRRAGIADILAFRGTVAGGIGEPVLLEDRAANAELAHVKLGRNGQQVVVWNYTDDLRTYAATSANASDAFVGGLVSDNFPGNTLVVTDEGQAILHSLGNGSRLSWTARDGWVASFTPGFVDSLFGFSVGNGVSRNGLVIFVDSGGMTATYDARQGAPVITPQSPAASRYVLGFSGGARLSDKPLISVNGVGFVDMLNDLVTLPTPAVPQGVRNPGSRTTSDTSALWGAFLK
jgi:hypothetical protein